LSVSVIIPNYNGVEHLEDCLESLAKQSYPSFVTILVDNFSDDCSIKLASQIMPDIKIIKLDRNKGFTGAVNEGITYSLNIKDIQYILLLNNDTICAETFIAEMVTGLETTDAGSAACKLLKFPSDDVKLIDAAGDFIKLNGGSPYARGHNEIDAGQYDKKEYVFAASGAASMYKRDVFEVVGLFDEDFFAYYEDVDLNLRMQLAGFKCIYLPEAVCYHKRGASFNKIKGLEIKLRERNLIYLRIKNYPFMFLLKYSLIFHIARLKRFYFYLTKGTFYIFVCAIKGFLLGQISIIKILRKRRTVISSIKVSNEYIKKLI